jgi:hypothetical protein
MLVGTTGSLASEAFTKASRVETAPAAPRRPIFAEELLPTLPNDDYDSRSKAGLPIFPAGAFPSYN